MSYSMSDLLQLMVSEGAADLHIRTGIPPAIRVHGALHKVEGPALTPDDTEDLMRSISSEDNIQQVRENGGPTLPSPLGMRRVFVSVSSRNEAILPWYCARSPARC